jgi:hypothetical protein
MYALPKTMFHFESCPSPQHKENLNYFKYTVVLFVQSVCVSGERIYSSSRYKMESVEFQLTHKITAHDLFGRWRIMGQSSLAARFFPQLTTCAYSGISIS